MPLSHQVIHPALGVILGSPGNFLIKRASPGSSACRGDGAGPSLRSPALHVVPLLSVAYFFGLMIWVNGSVLLADGSLPAVPAKAGFCTCKAGGQRLGNVPR